MDLPAQLRRFTADLRRRAMLATGRAVVERSDAAGGRLVQLQLTALAGETLDKVDQVQAYGFTSCPHPGAEAVLVAIGGSRAHPVVIAVDDRRYRLDLAEGEVAIYDDQGQSVRLNRDGITIATPNTLAIAADGDVSLRSETGDIQIAAAGDINLISATGNILISAPLGIARMEGLNTVVWGTASAEIHGGTDGETYT